jgi:hypothetical protein
MSYLLIPQEVSATTATVWVGVINETFDSAQLVIESDVGQLPVAGNAWQHWQSPNGLEKLYYQRVFLQGLQPRQTYPLRLRAGGVVRADAEVTLLPEHIPGLDEKPFTVLLGSCFFWKEDEAGTTGSTFFNMPAGDRPDIKILCGDQVYLDAPWHEFLLALPHREDNLKSRFFKTYSKTWEQSSVTAGFQQLLKRGGNFFSSDDHEFWNNAPNASFSNNTWSDTGREQWLKIAGELYRAFQTTSVVTTFDVGTLSFCIADTRINRDPDRGNFMRDDDLNRVAQWVSRLNGPGVLVVGQPILSKKTSFFKGHFGDWGLADYKQYDRLLSILKSSRHSMVILTGDVHYGRVASAPLNPMLGTEIIEVISSPMSLVDEAAAGKWEPAAEIFRQTQTVNEFAFKQRHFLTLEFSAASSRRPFMRIKFWRIVPNGELPQSQIVFERSLI